MPGVGDDADVITASPTEGTLMMGRQLGWTVVVSIGLFLGCAGEEPPDPFGPFCGGIAGFQCPGAGDCVDDPRDDCDPENGGADCSGVCECNAIGLCTVGFAWDSSPEVCGCVPTTNPCAVVLCLEGSECKVIGNEGVCVPTGPQPCGDTTCKDGTVCCNASCGICTPPGGVCIQLACE